MNKCSNCDNLNNGDSYLCGNKGECLICGRDVPVDTERTIEDVQERDLITNGERFRRVLGRAGQAVFLTLSWSKGGTERFESTGNYFSITGLKNEGWQIVTESTPEIKEMTVADVEKLVGTKVKIVK